MRYTTTLKASKIAMSSAMPAMYSSNSDKLGPFIFDD
jgi:hypothetical protein